MCHGFTVSCERFSQYYDFGIRVVGIILCEGNCVLCHVFIVSYGRFAVLCVRVGVVVILFEEVYVMCHGFTVSYGMFAVLFVRGWGGGHCIK